MFRLRLILFFQQKRGGLREQHGAEHERTAEQFPRRKALVQNRPARKRGKDRLQTHDDRRHGGLDVLLADDLKCVGDAGGQDAGI